MSDELDLDALEALAEAATPGPWKRYPDEPHYDEIATEADGVNIALAGSTVANAEFIAAARSAVPALVARVREAEAGLAETGFSSVAEVVRGYWNLDRSFQNVCNERADLRARLEASEREAKDRHTVQARCTDENRVLRRQVEKTQGRLDLSELQAEGWAEEANTLRADLSALRDAMKALAAEVRQCESPYQWIADRLEGLSE